MHAHLASNLGGLVKAPVVTDGEALVALLGSRPCASHLCGPPGLADGCVVPSVAEG